MELNRFKQLLESSMGNVKPLISEEFDNDYDMEDENDEELENNNEDDIRVPGTELTLSKLRDMYDETIKYYTLSDDGSEVIEVNGIPIEDIVNEIFGEE
jgi:hypothetical protein